MGRFSGDEMEAWQRLTVAAASCSERVAVSSCCCIEVHECPARLPVGASLFEFLSRSTAACGGSAASLGASPLLIPHPVCGFARRVRQTVAGPDGQKGNAAARDGRLRKPAGCIEVDKSPGRRGGSGSSEMASSMRMRGLAWWFGAAFFGRARDAAVTVVFSACRWAACAAETSPDSDRQCGELRTPQCLDPRP